MAILELRDIHKRYDDTPVLRGIDLDIRTGDIVALLGPSGCGKTTLLRLIAGLEYSDRGSIRFEGSPIEQVPTHKRGFGLMFQEYALFPHLDVRANVAFGLRAQGWAGPKISARVNEMLQLVGLSNYGKRRVYELSGGERQRVALARALAPGPRLLMLDEPLAALDRELRERLQDELRAILRNVQITALYVTHDQHEAFGLADQVVLLRAGRVVQHGPPPQLYRQPADVWAARFFGMRNQLSGIYRGAGTVETALGMLQGTAVGEPAIGATVQVIIAPDAAEIDAHAAELRGPIENLRFLGRLTRVTLRPSPQIGLEFEVDQLEAQPGEVAGVRLRPERVLIYPQAAGGEAA